MKITYNWLKEYVDFTWDWPELVERLSLTGLEREGVEDLGQRYAGVVVGQVQKCSKHPHADRLSVCQVDIGDQVCTIVCGAPNVAAGQKVPVALPGALLPGGLQIKKASIRGVESAGMICSEIELGLGEDAAGILVLPDQAPTGQDFAAQAGLEDVVLEFEVTPNRPDCLSLVGVAREVSALNGAELRMPPGKVAEVDPPTSAHIAIEIEDPESCPRYVGRVVRNVQVGSSPAWLQQRLQALGLRPINNVVDVTNYVMLELGQPLHAFDLHKLEDARIVVRRARPGEQLETLDQTHCDLDEEILVIADGRKPVALAGIMGGANSEVTEKTVDLLLESAYFSPVRVRQGRARLGLHTEASMRFERGADFAMPPRAIDRAARLIADLAGGQVATGAIDAYPRPQQAARIRARIPRLNQLLATDLDAAAAGHILRALGCQVEARGDTLEVLTPSFRPDLQREVDLSEEIGRIYGYDRIDGSQDTRGPLAPRENPATDLQGRIRHQLAGLGLDEVVSNTIIERRWLELAGIDQEKALNLANPPTEAQGVLRPTLVPSLLDVARRNFNQRATTAAIFELGKCFTAGAGEKDAGEQLCLAGLWAGRRLASTWRTDHQEVDILDLKGLLEVMLENMSPSFVPAPHPLCRPGHGARVKVGGCDLGYWGQVTPALAAAFDIERPVYIFELDFQGLLNQWNPRMWTFRPLAKFPPIERDLAVVLPQDISAADAVEQMRRAAPELIESVDLFDLYQGDQIEAGHKSLTFSIRLRSAEKTLEDQEANSVIDQVLDRLQKTFGATLRPG